MTALLKRVYNAVVRPLTPRTTATYNGVDVRWPRLLDATKDQPEYKAALVAATTAAVEPGDTVTVVGGGLGVSAVHAARVSDSVHVFEPAEAHAAACEETAARNGVAESVTVIRACVGAVRDAPGPVRHAPAHHPSTLDECDVLELDCEGAELDILEQVDIRPREIVVETHPRQGAETALVVARLRLLGYDIVDREPDSEAGHVLRGVYERS